MKRDDMFDGASAVGALALVVLLASLALIAAGGWTWFARFLESAAPAWVQAVGSVVAILAAVWIGKRQAETAIQLQRDLSVSEARRKLEVLAGLVDAAAPAIKEERDDASRNTNAWAKLFDDAEYKEYVDAAAALSINDLPSYALVKTLKEIRYRLFCCWDNLRDISSSPANKAHVDEMVGFLDFNLEALREARKTIAYEAKSLGIELPHEPLEFGAHAAALP